MGLETALPFQVPPHLRSQALQEERVLEVEAERHPELEAGITPGARRFRGDRPEAKEQESGEGGGLTKRCNGPAPRRAFW